jgi:NAD-dependent dihydropyrimidine dehydrogenase PreA subunit
MAKVNINQNKCTGCGACVDICPNSVFVMGDDGKSKVKNESACVACRACVGACPTEAITVEDD